MQGSIIRGIFHALSLFNALDNRTDTFTLEEIEQMKVLFEETIIFAVNEKTSLYHVEPAGCEVKGFEVCDWSTKTWINH